ncbi:glycosyl hydrolase [Actinoplanes sp. NPDC049118]|uniref:glycoside hydrolase family 26 protein n=1 Tax=Actinoplanes sp. NPDC049118 TaxID=3155769 RepID=UPI003405E3FF
MRDRTRTRLLHGTAVLSAAVFLTYAFTHPVKQLGSPEPAVAAPGRPGTSAVASSHPAAPPTYDLAALRKPAKKYLGVTVEGVPRSLGRLTAFSESIENSPNLVGYFHPYGDRLDVAGVAAVHATGALPFVQIEPHRDTIAEIAAGKTDDFLADFAADLRAVDAPVALSFGHEMNGDWYPWGTQDTSAEEFVAAWRHIHKAFRKAGVTSVLWVWNPNVTYPRPNVDIAELYPGDKYVDWVGVTGYYNTGPGGRGTFETLFQPTIAKVRTFTDKPVLIAETGASPSGEKPTQIKNLFTAVRARRDVVGFVWFNYHKSGKHETNWRIDSDTRSRSTFATQAQHDAFDFRVP